MEISNLTILEDFIFNYNKEDFFIENLKTITKNLKTSKIKEDAIFFLEKKSFKIEFEVQESLFVFELNNTFFSLQINSIEQYYLISENHLISEIINELFRGNYVIKEYIDKNFKLKYLKLIWGNKTLKKYNIKYKFGWGYCKNRIIKISIKNGISLLV